MNYFWLTLKHKWFVIVAGRRLRVSWLRLLLHDWTKLTPSELPHYQRQFFGTHGKRPDKYVACWTHHQNHNDHHWEYWIPRTGHSHCSRPYPDNEPISMPDQAVREMVADWLAAGRAYNGRWPDFKNWVWLEDNLPKMRINGVTLARLDTVLYELGVEGITL